MTNHGVASALRQKQTSRHVRVMSVIPLKADIHQRARGTVENCVLPRLRGDNSLAEGEAD